MGCDIHLYTEIKIDGDWYCYGHPNVPRNYDLFALMADVRNEDGAIHAISKPKGLPANTSIVARHALANPDLHSHSWLSAHELVLLDDAWQKYKPVGWEHSDLEHHFFGYLEGNSWKGFNLYPKDRKLWIEDVRFVFAFDN